ncbi:hypothetical protein ILT44_04350 [Microvirga sp. BT689]|uniref:hypothetical protein n=1 Tax=Microvirga arvi TaxID=2778731 RepID=UPI001951C2FA|nr:hypothetical protein [Microvirga arvi]MBM6579406.1 hypothetical protein [Microvirga arvi]
MGLPRSSNGSGRIRHYGLLANSRRVTNLARARALLLARGPPLETIAAELTDGLAKAGTALPLLLRASSSHPR